MNITAGEVGDWVDHQIFSPTHGYAWLTVENGFVTFVRKSREAPYPSVVTEYQIENSENRPFGPFHG